MPEHRRLALARRLMELSLIINSSVLFEKPTVRNRMRVGCHLATAKHIVRRGRWLAWLRDEFSMSERTAQGYMRLARHQLKLTGIKPAFRVPAIYRDA